MFLRLYPKSNLAQKMANFDVNKYRNVFESERGWKLKRDFLLAHKDTFEEDKLICLAQIYCNIEMDQCTGTTGDKLQVFDGRYSNDVMTRISLLAKDLKKSKMEMTAGPPKKKLKTAGNVTAPSPSDCCDESLANFVLLCDTKSDMNYRTILIQSASFNKVPHSLSTHTVENGMREATVTMNNCIIAKAQASTEREATQLVSYESIQMLSRRCPTIVVDKQHCDGIQLDQLRVALDEDTKQIQPEIENSIAARMMRSMGWTGGGLGKNCDGIALPISIKEQQNRAGLGSRSGMDMLREFKGNIGKMLNDYLREDNYEDLTFSKELSIEQRKHIHEICRKPKYKCLLKTTSRSSGNKRFISVSKIIGPWFVEDLQRNGNRLGKYRLFPQGTMVFPK